MTTIDFSQRDRKKLMLALALNLIIMVILALIPRLRIVGLIIYSIVLFVYFEERLKRIESEYAIITEELKLLSKGDFSFDFNEDVGVFNNLQAELKNISIGFESAVEEEMKSQNMKSELITNVSHDLKTPVTCIKNYVELLNDKDITPDMRCDYVNNIEHYTNRLEHLIEDLFDISKASSGNIQLDLEEIPMTSLVDQVIIEFEEQFTSKGLEPITNYTVENDKLTLDGSKTYRILENLFMNACKYSLENTRIYVDVSETDEAVQVLIKNISKNQLDFDTELIKERFTRGDSSRHEQGSGLGLAIVKSFTELQNGVFEVEVDGDLFKAILTFKK